MSSTDASESTWVVVELVLLWLVLVPSGGSCRLCRSRSLLAAVQFVSTARGWEAAAFETPTQRLAASARRMRWSAPSTVHCWFAPLQHEYTLMGSPGRRLWFQSSRHTPVALDALMALSLIDQSCERRGRERSRERENVCVCDVCACVCVCVCVCGV